MRFTVLTGRLRGGGAGVTYVILYTPYLARAQLHPCQIFSAGNNLSVRLCNYKQALVEVYATAGYVVMSQLLNCRTAVPNLMYASIRVMSQIYTVLLLLLLL
jgi:hypothetical protein